MFATHFTTQRWVAVPTLTETPCLRCGWWSNKIRNFPHRLPPPSTPVTEGSHTPVSRALYKYKTCDPYVQTGATPSVFEISPILILLALAFPLSLQPLFFTFRFCYFFVSCCFAYCTRLFAMLHLSQQNFLNPRVNVWKLLLTKMSLPKVCENIFKNCFWLGG